MVSSEGHEGAFVDDTGLAVDDREGDVFSVLPHNAQVNERDMYTMGGKLALERCFWTLIEWSWKDGDATIALYDLTKDSDNRLVLVNSEDGTPG